MFRARPCSGDNRFTNFQVASISIVPEVTALLGSMINILILQAEGELRFGMLPPSTCERALKQFLNNLGDESD